MASSRPSLDPGATRSTTFVGHFSHLFATGMKNIWQHRIYVDLFSGPGRVRFARGGPVFNSTPLIALTTRDPFDRYIFGDNDRRALMDLETRARRLAPDHDLRFVGGDANEVVDRVLAQVPRPSPHNRVLTFCVLDPFDISSLQFSTIKAIGSVFVDFFILVASHMDASRNWKVYQDPNNPTVDLFLGRSDWRDEWPKPEVCKDGFGPFIVGAFIESMRREKFELGMLEPVRLPRNNTPLYYLAGFSRNPRGVEFWRKAQKSADPEQQLPFGE